ncbi:hypothetical protein HanLR1_Chr07g0239311 [Helianthus annuus]|nr:hypothetical protein HanLR1_Chr07g0239311 [Helianthus annuus]
MTLYCFLAKHESYFVNLVTKLLSAYEEALKPSVDRVEKYVESLKSLSEGSDPPSNVDKQDSKTINPRRSLEEEYLDYEAKVLVRGAYGPVLPVLTKILG